MERVENDVARKSKLIFFTIAAIVSALLIWSVAAVSNAKSGLNAARQELETVKADNVRLEQILGDLSQENDSLKTKVKQLEAKVKAGQKTAAKKKTASKSSSNKTKKKRR